MMPFAAVRWSAYWHLADIRGTAHFVRYSTRSGHGGFMPWRVCSRFDPSRVQTEFICHQWLWRKLPWGGHASREFIMLSVCLLPDRAALSCVATFAETRPDTVTAHTDQCCSSVKIARPWRRPHVTHSIIEATRTITAADNAACRFGQIFYILDFSYGPGEHWYGFGPGWPYTTAVACFATFSIGYVRSCGCPRARRKLIPP